MVPTKSFACDDLHRRDGVLEILAWLFDFPVATFLRRSADIACFQPRSRKASGEMSSQRHLVSFENDQGFGYAAEANQLANCRSRHFMAIRIASRMLIL